MQASCALGRTELASILALGDRRPRAWIFFQIPDLTSLHPSYSIGIEVSWSQGMERLPDELLALICEHCEHTSLKTCRMLNKRFHDASTFLLFEHIYLGLFEFSLMRLREIARSSLAKHVKKLTIYSDIVGTTRDLSFSSSTPFLPTYNRRNHCWRLQRMSRLTRSHRYPPGQEIAGSVQSIFGLPFLFTLQAGSRKSEELMEALVSYHVYTPAILDAIMTLYQDTTSQKQNLMQVGIATKPLSGSKRSGNKTAMD